MPLTLQIVCIVQWDHLKDSQFFVKCPFTSIFIARASGFAVSATIVDLGTSSLPMKKKQLTSPKLLWKIFICLIMAHNVCMTIIKRLHYIEHENSSFINKLLYSWFFYLILKFILLLFIIYRVITLDQSIFLVERWVRQNQLME